METKKELTKKQLEFIADKVQSNKTIVKLCEEHGISRKTFYKWMKDKEFSEVLKGWEDNYKSMLLDTAHIKFGEHVENGNLTALIFLLKALGGWQENNDIGVNFKTPVIVVKDPKQKEAIENLTKRFTKEK